MRSGPWARSTSCRMLELTQPCTAVGKPIWPRLTGLSPGLQTSRTPDKKEEFSPDFERVPDGVDYALWRESGELVARDREEMAEDALGASGAILSHADHALAGDRPL